MTTSNFQIDQTATTRRYQFVDMYATSVYKIWRELEKEFGALRNFPTNCAEVIFKAQNLNGINMMTVLSQTGRLMDSADGKSKYYTFDHTGQVTLIIANANGWFTHTVIEKYEQPSLSEQMHIYDAANEIGANGNYAVRQYLAEKFWTWWDEQRTRWFPETNDD